MTTYDEMTDDYLTATKSIGGVFGIMNMVMTEYRVLVLGHCGTL